jgi:hypothetical protein
MTTFDNTNRGAIFRDDKKQRPEDRDYSGSINIAGVEYWLSGWIRTSKAGGKFLSLSVKAKVQAEPKPAVEDAIPF